jgi:hypothetical protein
MILPAAAVPAVPALPITTLPAPIIPPSTGDAGLATATSLLPLAGLLALTISGAAVLAVARRRA